MQPWEQPVGVVDCSGLAESNPEEVLDGFHVVVGRAVALGPVDFEPLDQVGVVGVEGVVAVADGVAFGVGEREVGRVKIGECDEVLGLDAEPGPHQAGFTRVRRQRGGPAAVSPVERRHRRQRVTA